MKQLLILILVGGMNYSCYDSGCSDSSVGNILNENSITFSVINKVSKLNLYTQSGVSNYNVDTLALYDQFGSKKSLKRDLLGNGEYRFIVYDIFDETTDELSSTIKCKNYSLYYKNNDVDTLEVCFSTKEGKCGAIFKDFKVYYDEELIYDGNGDARFYTSFYFEVPR